MLANDQNGETPLWLAAAMGNLEVAEELLKHGAKLEVANKVRRASRSCESWHFYGLASQDGATPLTIACANGKTELAKLLIAKGANMEAKLKVNPPQTPPSPDTERHGRQA